MDEGGEERSDKESEIRQFLDAQPRLPFWGAFNGGSRRRSLKRALGVGELVMLGSTHPGYVLALSSEGIHIVRATAFWPTEAA